MKPNKESHLKVCVNCGMRNNAKASNCWVCQSQAFTPLNDSPLGRLAEMVGEKQPSGQATEADLTDSNTEENANLTSADDSPSEGWPSLWEETFYIRFFLAVVALVASPIWYLIEADQKQSPFISIFALITAFLILIFLTSLYARPLLGALALLAMPISLMFGTQPNQPPVVLPIAWSVSILILMFLSIFGDSKWFVAETIKYFAVMVVILVPLSFAFAIAFLATCLFGRG